METSEKIRHVKNYVKYNLSYAFNRPLTLPFEINFQMTNRCPLSCRMCNIPKIAKSPAEELTVEEMKNVLDQIADWATSGIYVSFVGGESLVRKNDTIELVKHANSKNFHTTIVSNAHFLDKQTCNNLLDAGLKRLAISLDGATAATHDFIRGKGSFKKVIETMNYMLEARKAKQLSIKLDFNTVIMSHNFREAINIYHLAKKMGVDQVFYQAVVPDNTFQNKGQSLYKTDLWIQENHLAELESTIKKLIEIKRGKGSKIISNSIKYLQLIPSYFAQKNKFKPGPCLAGFVNLNIDPYGNITTCGLGPNVNVKDGKLTNLWKSKEFAETRKKIKSCRQPCLMLCYEKLNLRDVFSYLIK